jgi:hypothetical protein
MRQVSKLLIALAWCTAVCSKPAFAATIVFSGTLSGLSEFPANGSTGTGSFGAILDDSANSFSVDISFAGLTSNAASGNVHCCAAAGANAPGILTFINFPSVTSGTYSNTFVGLSSARVTEIKSGLAYINIHTLALPGGEIRAQLTPAGSPAPEPATWALFIGGFGLVGLAMRRRNRTSVRLT